MLDEVKNVYIRQAEVKGSFDQSKTTGLVSLKELTVNTSLKNYKKVLNEAFEITMDTIDNLNSKYDKEKVKQERKNPETTKKETKQKKIEKEEKKENEASVKGLK